MYVLFQFATFLNETEKTEYVEKTSRGQPVDVRSIRQDIANILRVDIEKILIAKNPNELITVTKDSRMNGTCTWYAVGDQHGKLVAQPFEIRDQKSEQGLKNGLNDSIRHFINTSDVNYHSFFAMSPDSTTTKKNDAEDVDLATTTPEREVGKDSPYGLLTYAFAVASLLTVRPKPSSDSTASSHDSNASSTEKRKMGPRLRRMPKITYVDLTKDRNPSKYGSYTRNRFDDTW